MLKAYKYRIPPTKDQQDLIMTHFGVYRFVYNWALEQKIKTYEQSKNHLSRFDLQNILVHKVKRENDWLKTVNSQALLSSLINVESAFTKFFREKTGFPNFKSKKIQYNLFNYHNIIMWILKTILLCFLRLEKLK